MSQEAIRTGELMAKHIQGTLTPVERAELETLMHTAPAAQELLDQYNSAGIPKTDQDYLETLDSIKVWKQLQQKTKAGRVDGKHRSIKRWFYYAAAILLMVSFATLYLHQSDKQVVDVPLATTHDVEPGMNKAKLTLSDGRELLLDDVETGELLEEPAGISIQKTADGQLTYTIHNTGKDADIHSTNTISTPRGGQYRVILPDGTKVWLNSSSSLTYPVHFADNSRRVKMTGETYFEVSKSLDGSGKRIPFFVESPNQTIEVLGTHFNINAYSDEENIRTTLLEGSVRLTSVNNREGILLKPGEQAKLYNERFSVTQVNVESAVDWKNGDFIFANENLPAIMRKIARWYDVDIQYQQGLSLEENFNGRVSRGKKLSEVIKVLSISADIDLKIVDQKILISHKK